MAYHGAGQGITAYVDGTQIGRDTGKISSSKNTGDGWVSVGKRTVAGGGHYVSASVDEIKFYNRQLTQQEICDMY